MLNINGLSDKEVVEKRHKYGTNSITGKNKNTFFNLFIETLGDPIIKILLIALAIKTIFLFKDFDYFETFGIVVAILVASLISALSEYGSNKAFQRMQEESSKINVRVKRNSKLTTIPVDEIVVGDIVLLSEGDKVPADGTIIEGSLYIDESSLNGETKEAYKESVPADKLESEENHVYRGTTIYEGEAVVEIKKVGLSTMYGKMAKTLTTKQDTSPLKARLTHLAKIISKIGYISAILIALSYLFSKIFISNNFDISLISKTLTLSSFMSLLLEALTLAVSVLVMSVPEGLPMMITLVLSTNSKKMLKNNVLVRKMVGIETAGSLNILFTDKTGTLTKGKMEVYSLLLGDNKEYNSSKKLNNEYKKILLDSIIYNNESNYDEITNKVIGGNQTDKALFAFANMKKNNSIKVKDKLEFNSKNKFSVSIIEKNNKMIKLIKGSPEEILKYSDSYIDINGKKKPLDKDLLLNQINIKTKEGLRAIAVAISTSIYPIESLRRNTIVAIIFLKDEIRSEASSGISLIKSAGITPVMITGDALDTATNIAKEVGIISNKTDITVTSNDLKRMTDEELKQKLPNIKVIARALPTDKERLVKISKELGLVVGMTGDGVNDSIALKEADVSFAMGTGTEVAKEASDIVILDDNIISISKAILYGRTIFKNIRKFIIFQLTVNISALSLALIGPFIGVATPVTVIQMLWINMVMDTLAGLAFSYEVPRIEYMSEPPKKRSESILNKYMIKQILAGGIYSSAISLFFLKSPFVSSIYRNNETLMTAFFSLFIFLAVFNSFNARTHRLNIFVHLKENKVFILIIIFIIIVQILIIYSGITLFRTVPINKEEFIFMFLLSFTIIPLDFLRKLLLTKKGTLTGV